MPDLTFTTSTDPISINPVAKVELCVDDPGVPIGSATWIDISDYVIDDGIKTARGRQSELDRFQAGTGSVLLRNRDGRFDPTNVGGTNYVTNPSAEVNTTGWTQSAGATLTRVSGGQVGSWSFNVISTVFQGYMILSAPVYTTVGSEWVTISAWVKADSPQVMLRLRDHGASVALGDVTHSGGNTWERLSVTRLVASGTQVTGLVFDNRASGWTAYQVDGVQIERASYATNYIDGTQTSCSWTGTAHASTSTRPGSPYSPNLRPMNRIRISQTWSGVSYPQMVAYVPGWPPSYPGPEHSVVNVPLVDAFSVLAIPTLTTPSTYSDNGGANLLRNGSVEVDEDDYEANAATIATSTTNELFGTQSLRLTTTNVTNSHVRYDRDSNVVVVPGLTYTASVYVALAVAASKLMTFHIDFYNGASLVNSVSQSVTITSTGWVRLMVSGVAGALTDRASVILGTNGAQGVFDLYTDGWQFEVLSANLASLPEERSNLRIGRCLDAIGWPTADRVLSAGASILLEQTELSKTSTLSELQLIEQSENGRLWINRSGQVQFLSRWDMGLSPYTTSQTTFGQTGADLPYVNVQPSYDLTFLHNEIRLTGTQPGAIEQVATDAISEAHYYTRTLAQTGLLVSDNELKDAVNYELERYATVHLRFLTLEVSGLSDPANLWPQLLGRELGDRITVKFTPPGSGLITQECFIEGIAHDFSRKDRWKTTFSLSAYGIGYLVYPAGKYFFVLGDATYGTGSGPGVLVY